MPPVTNHAPPMPPDQPSLRRGAQARLPLRAAIIGGGKACEDLLAILDQARLRPLNLAVVGVADPDPHAPGILRAQEMGIYTAGDFSHLFSLPGLNLIIELTGHPGVRERLLRHTPKNVSIIDHRGARLLWDLVQIEMDKTQVERQAEATLKRERDWFQEILDSLTDSIMVLDPRMRIVMVNRTFLQAAGLGQDQVLGRTCHQMRYGLAEPCDRHGVACPFRRVMETRAPVVVMHNRGRAGGPAAYEEVSATPIFDSQGRVIQVVEGVRDVTSRVRLEAELRETEGKLMALMESAQELISIKDLDGRYLYANPAYLELSGLTAEAIRGRSDFEVYPPAVARAMLEQEKLVRQCRSPLCFDEMVSLGGRGRWLHTVRYPILDHQGQMTALSIISHDVTEEKALEEEVGQAHDYMEAVLTNASDIIITTDLEGRVVTINPAGARLLGYEPGELKGRPVGEVWQEPELRQSLMRRIVAEEAVNNHPAVLLAKDGRQVEITLSLARLKDGQGRVLGTVGISRDVTEENRLKRQLIESERLIAIGQTVAGLAHCIKNILFGLKGGAYLVDSGLARGLAPRVQEGWQTVQACIGRISDLSLDMLSYTREREPDPRPTDPAALVEAVLAMVGPAAAQAGVALSADCDPGPDLPLDPDLLTRALLNLLTNAVDACHEKDYPAGQAPQVRVEARRRPGQIQFVVSDNGTGMAPEVVAQLFTRFFTTKQSRGTGLGLAVSQKLVAEHGGEVRVDSTPGQGSVFTIHLPLAADAPSDANPA
ncbi:MAG: PAS domain-containing protein [Pseudomonadota bacterium]